MGFTRRDDGGSMTTSPEQQEKRLRLRRDDRCRECGADLPAGTQALYERQTRAVRCLAHATPAPASADHTPVVDPGVPGGSARREFERRKDRREQRIRAKHPRLGGAILALSEDPQTTKAWDTGALGEERLGARLNELATEQVRPLHDRRIPGSRANIDHIVVAPSGIYVIDAKRYRGRPRLEVTGGIVRARQEKLLVGSRDCTKLVEAAARQVDVVTQAAGGVAPVHGVLCFVDADWPLIGGAFTVSDVHVVWPRRLYALIATNGPLDEADVSAVHAVLAKSLPSA